MVSLRTQYLTFFLGVSLVSTGSPYYHLSPNDATLVWDRLPMTVGFMALLSVIVSEYINQRIGRRLFIPLLLIGMLSVWYWAFFDDLSFYLLVQYYPMIAIPVMLIFYKSKQLETKGYWLLILAYLIAKIFEYYDAEVHALVFLSGHSLKHIMAALGIYLFITSHIADQRKASRTNS